LAANPDTSTRHGLYCGAITSFLSHVNGNPYQFAPASKNGVELTKPDTAVIIRLDIMDFTMIFIEDMVILET
jgi:hypothetical protein